MAITPVAHPTDMADALVAAMIEGSEARDRITTALTKEQRISHEALVTLNDQGALTATRLELLAERIESLEARLSAEEEARKAEKEAADAVEAQLKEQLAQAKATADAAAAAAARRVVGYTPDPIRLQGMSIGGDRY